MRAFRFAFAFGMRTRFALVLRDRQERRSGVHRKERRSKDYLILLRNRNKSYWTPGQLLKIRARARGVDARLLDGSQITDFLGIRKRRSSFAGRQLVLAVLHNLIPVKFALLDCEPQMDIAGVDEFPCSLSVVPTDQGVPEQ